MEPTQARNAWRSWDRIPASCVGGFPDFIRLGDKILFSLQTVPNGFELWRTDGTEAGTEPFLSQLAGTEILDGARVRPRRRLGVLRRVLHRGRPAPLAVTDGTAGGDARLRRSAAARGARGGGRIRTGRALGPISSWRRASGGSAQLWAVIPTELVPRCPDVAGRRHLDPTAGGATDRRPGALRGQLSRPAEDARDHLILSDGTAIGTIERRGRMRCKRPVYPPRARALGDDAYLRGFQWLFYVALEDERHRRRHPTEIEADDCASGCECESFPMGVSGAKLYFLARVRWGRRRHSG